MGCVCVCACILNISPPSPVAHLFRDKVSYSQIQAPCPLAPGFQVPGLQDCVITLFYEVLRNKHRTSCTIYKLPSAVLYLSILKYTRKKYIGSSCNFINKISQDKSKSKSDFRLTFFSFLKLAFFIFWETPSYYVAKVGLRCLDSSNLSNPASCVAGITITVTNQTHFAFVCLF